MKKIFKYSLLTWCMVWCIIDIYWAGGAIIKGSCVAFTFDIVNALCQFGIGIFVIIRK